MKWRNSKERELLSAGGSREQTLPTKNNPCPDLSDVKNDPTHKKVDLNAKPGTKPGGVMSGGPSEGSKLGSGNGMRTKSPGPDLKRSNNGISALMSNLLGGSGQTTAESKPLIHQPTPTHGNPLAGLSPGSGGGGGPGLHQHLMSGHQLHAAAAAAAAASGGGPPDPAQHHLSKMAAAANSFHHYLTAAYHSSS